MNRAVFLDRDGVLNRVVLQNGRPHPPASVQELEFLPGVAEALAALRRAGFRLIVATNQPDVRTGRQHQAVVEAMHEQIRRRFPIDDIEVCYHIDEDNCACRKPRPGMLLTAASKWRLSLRHSVMVGDRWRDIEAGKAAGCNTILVRGLRYGERQAEDPDAVVGSLAEASVLICASRWAQEPSEVGA